MRKNLVIAVGWVAFLGFAACTVQVKDENTGAGGSSSTGSAGSATAGSSAGSGGTGSTAGAAGHGGSSAGSAGSSDSLGDASLPGYKDARWDSADGGCINDSTDGGDTANPDLCSTLNGADSGSQCYDASPGRQLCDLMQQNARPGAFQVFFKCIDAQTKSDPCADVAHISVCVDDAHWPTGCQVGKVVVSNGKSWDCTNLVARCPATDGGPDGFTLPECDFIMNVFNDDARTRIFDCYLSKPGASDPTTCKADFTDCVYNPDQL
jgi:hypothetical protein